MRGWSSRCSTRASRISSSWALSASADASESTFTTQRSPVWWSSARCVVVARPRPRMDWSSYRPFSRRSLMRGRPLLRRGQYRTPPRTSCSRRLKAHGSWGATLGLTWVARSR